MAKTAFQLNSFPVPVGIPIRIVLFNPNGLPGAPDGSRIKTIADFTPFTQGQTLNAGDVNVGSNEN